MTRITMVSAGVLLAAAFVATLLQAQKPAQAAEELRVGVAATREIGAGHDFRIHMEPGGFARVQIDALDIGLTLTIFDPGGAEAVRLEKLTSAYGSQEVVFVAHAGGVYRMKVEPFEDATGRFTLLLAESRASTFTDADRIIAQSTLFDAIRLIRRGGAGELSLARRQLEVARQKYRELNDLARLTLAECWLGTSEILQAETKAAAGTFVAAASAWHELAERRGEAQALSFQADSLLYTGQPDRVLALYNQALTIRREVGDRRGEAEALHGIAAVHVLRGENTQAIQFYKSALAIRRSLGDRSGQAGTLANLGTAYTNEGENRSGVESLESALALVSTTRNPRSEATILMLIARTYGLLGEMQKALDFAVRGLTAAQKLSDCNLQAVLLNNLGTLYQLLGQYRRAQEYFTQSLALKRELQDRRGEGATLGNLGWLALAMGQYRQALDSFESALPLLRGNGDRLIEGNVLNDIGDVRCEIHDFEAALDYYRQALALRTAIGDRRGEAYSRIGFGRAYMGLKRYAEATDSFEQGLVLSRGMEDRNAELGSLDGLARASVTVGSLEQAHRFIESALQILEAERAKIVLPELRTSYLALHQEYYELAIEVLMRLNTEQPNEGFRLRALEVHERGQARSLVELLREAGANIRNGVPPELLIRERNARELLTAAIEKRLQVQLANDRAKDLPALNKEIEKLSTTYDQVESDIRGVSPDYAALTQPAPLTAVEIERELTDDTVILEYSLGAERSFGWLVTRSAVQPFELPPRRVIEDMSRRFYGLISVRMGPTGPVSTNIEQVARRLGATLIGPIASAIHGKKLVIVPAGVLCYLPFDALGDPEAGSGSFVPLIAGHVISTLPSASVLPLLRTTDRLKHTAPRMVAVLADPVFEKSDPRVHSTG